MIKNWKLFKESVDSEFNIHKLCKEYNIKNYTINDDFSIDVDDDVDLSYRDLDLDKVGVKFRRVSGNFYCKRNGLSSLLGCPDLVYGGFVCSNNYLTSLENLPKSISYISFEFNKIWSFKGIPDSFRGELYCFGNPIYEIWNLYKTSKDIEFFNDCHIVREPETTDGLPIVVLERLNYFLDVIGKPTVEGVEGYINI
jgi:hypothetical protein